MQAVNFMLLRAESADRSIQQCETILVQIPERL